jgi:hypothetical protein
MNWLSLLGVTDVEVNVIEGFSPVPKKSLVRRWVSRCASLVSIVSALISTETRPLVKLSPSVSIVPDSSVKRPRTLVNMCRTVNDAPEWLGSIVQTVVTPLSVPALSSVSLLLIVISSTLGHIPASCPGVFPQNLGHFPG